MGFTTKYRLADSAKRRLDNGNSGPNENIGMQELILAVHESFGTVVKNSYFQNKSDGITEINGNFIYSFPNQPVLFDNNVNLYYTVIPSSYIDTPNETGITYVNTMQSGSKSSSQSEPMVRLINNWSALSRGLAVEGLQGRRGFFTEGVNIYFTSKDVNSDSKILLKLAVSLEGIDEDTQINIAPELQDMIINAVVAKYSPELKEAPAKIGDVL